MKIPLVGPSYPAYSLAVSAQSSNNCYLESVETKEGKSQFVLRGRPGIALFKNLTTIDAGATNVRALWSGGGRLFVVAGNKEFEVSSAGALVGAVNTVANDTNPAQIIPNSNQLLIVSGGNVYCDNGTGPVQIVFPALSGTATSLAKLLTWSPTPNSSTGHTDTFDAGMNSQAITFNGSGFTVQAVTNSELLALATSAGVHSDKDWSSTPILSAATGAFLDGFYFVPRVGTRQVNGSNLLDGSTWDPLTVALKEGWPDNVQALWAEPPLMYVLGTETLEAWRNTGAVPFPLERVDGGFARIGCAATWSCASIGGRLHMLAGGSLGQVVAVRMDGITPVRISTHAVEEALKGYAFPTQGFAYSYLDRGHWFWVINILAGQSWVYDATESAKLGEPQWHQRASWSGSAFTSEKAQYHTFIPEWGVAGKHIVGDGGSGKLYVMDSDIFDDDGADIRYVRALAYVYSEGHRMYHHRIDFEMETGTSAVPLVVTLDWSDDRGQTWGTGAGVNTFRTLGPGVNTQYSTRFYAAGLGSSRGRIYRISVQGKGRLALIEASLEVTEGQS